VNYIARLKMSQKLGAIIAVLLLPMCYIGVQYVQGLQSTITEHERADRGLQYFSGMQEAGDPLAAHASLTAAILAGESDAAYFDVRIREARSRFETAMAKQDGVEAQLGEPGSREHMLWAGIGEGWSGLSKSWSKLTPEDSAAKHDALAEKFIDLARQVSHSYGLNRDADAQQFYMQNVAVEQLPRIIFEFGRLRAAAMPVAAQMLAVTQEQERRVTSLLANIRYLMNDVRWKFELLEESTKRGSASGTEGVESALAGLERAGKAMDTYEHWLSSNILTRRPVAVASQEVMEQGAPFAAEIGAVQKLLVQQVEARSAARLRSEVLQRNLSLAFAAAMLAAALLLAVAVTRSLVRSMRDVVDTFGAIEAGKYDNVIATKTGDEVGLVLQSLGRMQTTLKDRIEREHRALVENVRVRQALDKASVNVFLLNAELEIIYINEAASMMLTGNEALLRRDLPSLNAASVIGAPYDVLARNPLEARQTIQSLIAAQNFDERLGTLTFRVAMTPILDADGKRLGTVVEWRNRTPEVTAEDEIRTVLARSVDGDLTMRLSLEGKTGFFATLGQDLNQLLANTAQIIGAIGSSVQSVKQGSEAISSGSASLSERTEHQSSTLEETAAAMEQMSATVRQNAESAAKANDVAKAARSQAENGAAVIADTVGAMQKISTASKRISDVIGVIDEIAFQTNLLALNAAVEAARAGEQGRGFAIVAMEVRQLAGRSAAAAKEIKVLIKDSVTKVEEGTKLADQSGKTLEEILSAVQKVTELFAGIMGATQEQSTGIDEVNRAVTQMGEITQQNAALAVKTAEDAAALVQQTNQLTEVLDRYRTVDASAGLKVPGKGKIDAFRRRA
jgi:methyl-accepting chemotaxis protein